LHTGRWEIGRSFPRTAAKAIEGPHIGWLSIWRASGLLENNTVSNMRVVPVGRMGDLPETVDVAIIGSGIGGSTIAYGLAGSGARIVVLERGSHLGAHPAARDTRAIF
jgi:hypothetical protein